MEEKDIAEREFGLEEERIGLEEEAIEESRRASEATLGESKRISGIQAGLQKKQIEAQEKQAKRGQYISGAQTAVTGAYVGSKFLPAKAATTTTAGAGTGAQTGAIGGTGVAPKTGAGVKAGTTGKTSGWGGVGAAHAIGLAIEDIGTIESWDKEGGKTYGSRALRGALGGRTVWQQKQEEEGANVPGSETEQAGFTAFVKGDPISAYLGKQGYIKKYDPIAKIAEKGCIKGEFRP
ncbi:unnamed protein product, partial [marine sediment metagenome]